MSKEKRRVPKLRFPGFTEDWEQRKLGDVTNIKTGSRNQQDSVANGKYPFFIRSEKIEKLDAYDFDTEAILVPGDGRIGEIFHYYNGKFALHQRVYKVDDFKGVDAFYLLYLFQCKFKEHALRLNAQGTVPSLRLPMFTEWNINIPSLQEQICIGRLLNKIDLMITLHQRKLDKLKLKKKALLQKLFPKNGERYPELRFPGFTDAWEQCKLGEIFEYLQNNTLSRDSLNYKNPNIKNIHYGDILVKFDEILDGSNKDIPYINSELDLSKFSKSLLRDGDIIFSDTAEDDTVGKAIELQNVNAPFILGGLHTIPCRPLIPFGKGYLGNFLNSDSYRLQLRPLVQGIKVSSISKSALKDTMIEYPKTLDEQEKIGSLFYYIAKMITLHQRKLDHLQLQKKALLQQMFV